jgi:sugar phosphate isomerase/epimerase
MDQTRRDFIKRSAMGSALIALGGGSLISCKPTGQIRELGLIMGVLKNELNLDYKGTIRKVADIGYKYLEIGNYPGRSREDFKEFLKELNLVPIAGGSSIGEMMDEEKLRKLCDDALYMGKKYMICYWPWLDGGPGKTLDDFLIATERINKAGKICKEMGIRFAFHNHDQEFISVKGYQWAYEAILENTDPGIVDMELDLYWAVKGGGDPLTVFNKYPGRFKIFHVKDMDNTAEKVYTCPGYGIIDFAKIFSKSEKAGVEYYIVEIDKHPEPIQCVRDSYDYLMNLRF